MRLTPRLGLAASAMVLSLVCLGVGFVASRFGLLETLFEPGSAAAPSAWIGVAVLASAIGVCLLLAIEAPLGPRARAAIAILAGLGLAASLAYARLLAPFLALVAGFAFAWWREARVAR